MVSDCNINLDIPKNKLVVLTEISGSGKSSLTFDTIHTDGQRSCTIPLFIAAAKGKTSVFERKTVVCPSGKAGFGQFLGERFMVQSNGENGKVK